MPADVARAVAGEEQNELGHLLRGAGFFWRERDWSFWILNGHLTPRSVLRSSVCRKISVSIAPDKSRSPGSWRRPARRRALRHRYLPSLEHEYAVAPCVAEHPRSVTEAHTTTEPPPSEIRNGVFDGKEVPLRLMAIV